ncbi:MAG TPA: protein kinase [Ktedonobacteraceae bacterium]|jgi:serine/threonine-protein kinase
MPEEQTPLTTLPPGTLLRKRYLVRNVLRAGRSGTIYLVKDQQEKNSRHQLFALKEIAGLDQQTRYHLTVGSLTLRHLRHPALPAVHSLFNDDKRGCVYAVMDYIEGTGLETLRRQQPDKRLNWSELRGICEQVVAALTYLHLQDPALYHGDLKPDCIVRNQAGRAILLGLDYSQTVVSTQAPPAAPFSSSYAPEQFSDTIDARTDVFGLGAVLYELLTGQRPVDALVRLARVQRRRTDPLVPASKLAPGLAHSLAEALHRALALNPDERFQSIKAFWQTLSTLPEENQGETQAPAPRLKTPATSAITLPAETMPLSQDIPAVRIVPLTATRRSPLLLVALLCALLLLFAGVSTLFLEGHRATPGERAGTPTPPTRGGSPVLSSPNAFANILGKYTGYFYFFDKDGNATAHMPFTLIIDRQNRDQFTGIFVTPGLTGTVRGTTDQYSNVVWTIIDTSGNARITFSGGLNGIYASQTNTKDSGGGTLTRCQVGHGPTCSVAPGSGNGGIWTLNLIPAAF